MTVDYKVIIFFFAILFTLFYLATFRNNDQEKVAFHFLGQKMEINLGLLLFGIFIDGALLGALIFWLLA